MDLLELFKQYGGLASWLFIVGLPPQVWTNWKKGRYTSGSLGTWGLYIIAYFSFGLYMLSIGQFIVAGGQFVGFVLCVTITIQSKTLSHAS